MNEVFTAIYSRRTVRDFKHDQISDDDLNAILEAGHQAPSAWNRQPWYFTVTQKRSVLERIEKAARDAFEANFPEQAEAMPWIVAPGFRYFYNAPTVVFISGQLSVSDYLGDCAIAMTNMIYAAHSLGIQSCSVVTALPAFKTEEGPEFLKDLEIPEGFTPVYGLALGYTAKPMPPAAPRKEDFVNFIR